jgi:hypothetical protein
VRRAIKQAITAAIICGIGFAAGMMTETSRVGDLIVMRDTDNNCIAYDPKTQHKTPFGPPGGDGICHLAKYRAIW